MPDLGHRDAARLSDDRRRRQAAEPALARAHAAAGEGFGLIGPLAAERDGPAQRRHAHLLAAADHDRRILGRQDLRPRPVQGIEEAAQPGKPRQRPALGPGQALAGRRVDGAQAPGGIEARKPAAMRRRLGAADAGAVAHDRDGLDRTRAAGVGHRAPIPAVLVPSDGAARRHGQVRVGHDALVQQQQPGLDAPAPAPGQEFDRLDPPVAGRLDLARAFEHRDARRLEGALPAQTLAQRAEMAEEPGQPGQRLHPVAGRRGVEERGNGAADGEQLRGVEQDQRPAAGDHRRRLRHQGGGLEQGLGRAHGHDAGQGPAGDRHGALHGAGGDDHAPRAEEGGARSVAQAESGPGAAVSLDRPDRGLRPVPGAAGPERRGQREPRAGVRPEEPEVMVTRLGQAFDVAVDPAAGRRLLVEQDHVQAQAGGAGRRRQAGRAGAHHGEVMIGAHDLGSRGEPRQRTRKPSRTGTRQAWRSPWPSISTRQPKQEPIMQ